MCDPELTSVTERYMKLKDDTTRVEYVWINFFNNFWRFISKVRNVDETNHPCPLASICAKIPKWTYEDEDSSGILKPKVNYKDPFRPKHGYVILCETLSMNREPTIHTKNRRECDSKTHATRLDGHYFHIEQEFHFHEYMDVEITAARKDTVRKILECFYKACNYAGLCIGYFDLNNHSCFYYMCGPNNAVRVSDELWMSRFIMQRVAEEFHLTVNFGPRIPSGFANTRYFFSTYNMREGTDEEATTTANFWMNRLENRFIPMLRNAVTYDHVEGPIPTFSLIDQGKTMNCVVHIRTDIDPYVVCKTILGAASSIDFAG
ncbi:glutamine synthetase, mitochondrial-like [Phymastichus coffea]|uniref:glutamine synthetase, mitochondrial-like n=1 Tax=Phymastichus coffea TaxID=108790 RepID=UPI00273A77B1|nr:glutamine synthetase, mitochondrial-like [Phymastichus coffea]